jgi:hypothetical protein
MNHGKGKRERVDGAMQKDVRGYIDVERWLLGCRCLVSVTVRWVCVGARLLDVHRAGLHERDMY